MSKRRLVHSGGTALICLLVGSLSAVCGQDWATAMFDHTSHDFGTVARGAKVEHRFSFENIYLEDARIASVRSTCGCTTPEFPTHVLKTWDKAEIIAKLDTRAFLGQKQATLKVVFDKPFPAEVQLRVHAYIRSDVVVQPGVVQFGSVDPSAGPLTRNVTVDYAGRPNWQITGVETASPYLEAQAVETHRSAGQVTYDLRVTLKENAPVGYLQDQLVLVTNDTNVRAARVPVAVEGEVTPAVAVRPSSIQGVADPGKTLTRRLVVQGRSPFRVTGVRCSDPRLKMVAPKTSETVHLIPVTFVAGENAEKVEATIRIETDLPAAKPLDVPVHIRVITQGPMAF